MDAPYNSTESVSRFGDSGGSVAESLQAGTTQPLLRDAAGGCRCEGGEDPRFTTATWVDRFVMNIARPQLRRRRARPLCTGKPDGRLRRSEHKDLKVRQACRRRRHGGRKPAAYRWQAKDRSAVKSEFRGIESAWSKSIPKQRRNSWPKRRQGLEWDSASAFSHTQVSVYGPRRAEHVQAAVSRDEEVKGPRTTTDVTDQGLRRRVGHRDGVDDASCSRCAD